MAPTSGPARVLIAVTSERSSAEGLSEAHAFAERLGAELHVIRVVSKVGSAGSRAPRDLAHAIRESHRVLAAARHTRKVCDRLLEAPLPSTRISVRLGRFLDQVAQRAAELEAQIIIVSRTTRRLAPSVMELARRTDCGILVLKGSVAVGSLLVATDLEDQQVPLLRKAARLGRELQAAVVAVHSVSAAADGGVRLEQTRQRLERAARSVAVRLEPIILRAQHPAEGILREARARSAGLIVVGTRSRGLRTAPSTAARLIENAGRSILVEPLGLPRSWPAAAS